MTELTRNLKIRIFSIIISCLIIFLININLIEYLKYDDKFFVIFFIISITILEIIFLVIIIHFVIVLMLYFYITYIKIYWVIYNKKRNISKLENINIEKSEMSKLDCCICLENIDDGVKLKCNHILHKNCLDEMLEYNLNKCPLCCQNIV